MANSYETVNIYLINLRPNNTNFIDNGSVERKQQKQDPVPDRLSSRAMIDSHFFRIMLLSTIRKQAYRKGYA